MFKKTLCNFIMIGASAIVNPLIFLETQEYLQTTRLPNLNKINGLTKFLRQYSIFLKDLELKGHLKIIKRSYLDFLIMRWYIKKIKVDKIKLI